MTINTWQAGILNDEAEKLFKSRLFKLKVQWAWWLKSSRFALVRKLGVKLLDHTTRELRKANR